MRGLRKLHAGAQWHLHEVQYLWRHLWVQLTKSFKDLGPEFLKNSGSVEDTGGSRETRFATTRWLSSFREFNMVEGRVRPPLTQIGPQAENRAVHE